MNSRWLVLLLLLAPMLWLGLMQAQRVRGTEPVLPRLQAAEVARIELSRDDERIVMVRDGEGGWIIPSAADAPGDPVRIEAALSAISRLRGRPLAADAPDQPRAPLDVRLADASGRPVAHIGFWTGEARQLPAGARLAVDKTPALPLWPSAWSSLRAPDLPVDRIAAVAELTPEGPKKLDGDAAVDVAQMLADLSATGFVGGDTVGWAGARLLRVTLTDGTAIDLQQVPDGEGRYFLRMTSDTLDSVRATRRFAFLVTKPLP